MRRTRATATAGKVNMPAPLSREFALLAVLLAIGLWVAYSFAQEAYLNHRLGQEAADLKRANQILATQNDGYRRDIGASTAGAAAEEEARLNGYARPEEHVYVVNRPLAEPSPAANQKTTGHPAAAESSAAGNAGKHGILETFAVWIANLWHR